MGRVYAGILGPLAMAVIIGRGVLGSSGTEGTLTTATICLFLFAAVGAILGQVAEATIDESVRSKLQEQLSHQQATAPE